MNIPPWEKLNTERDHLNKSSFNKNLDSAYKIIDNHCMNWMFQFDLIISINIYWLSEPAVNNSSVQHIAELTDLE